MRQSLLSVQLQRHLSRPIGRRSFTSSSFFYRAFAEGDIVILRDKKDASQDGALVKLQQGKEFHSHRGKIEHSAIIGKQSRQLVRSAKGTDYRIHEPTLADYVRFTPRLVTPIYPSDTNLIVSLLDIHVDTFSGDTTSPPLEILEAGTGHGALTLHLSRAIHAANPPRPRTLPTASGKHEPEDAVYGGESVSDLEESRLKTWKTNRRAIVHTLDISSKHSKHAKKIVEGFRRGIYAGNVDFHVGDVSEWIASQKVARNTGEPFLSYVFLDLPGANHHLANVAPVLQVNGLLAVFNPSITQIVECVETIREHKLPYILDQVIELGAGNIRQWDVRAVRPRATIKKTQEPSATEVEVQTDSISSDEGSVDPLQGQQARDGELVEDLAKQQEKWAMVCRPKVGDRVVGGGFLALWRRMEPAMPARSGEDAEESS